MSCSAVAVTSLSRRCAFASIAIAVLMVPAIASGQDRGLLVRGLPLGSSNLQDTLALPYWRALSSVSCANVRWKPDYSSASAFRQSTAPLRLRLQREVGSALQQPAGNVLARSTIFQNARYRIERVTIGDRIPNSISFGFLATPTGGNRSSAPVVLIHGSGMAPQEAFDWQLKDQYPGPTRFKGAAFVRSAIELVESGYTVFVPWIADDNTSNFWPLAQWGELERNGSMLRAKTGGLGVYYLVANQISGGVDFLATVPNVDMTKLSVIGWAEGAQIASVVAAFDNRVAAVVRLAAPVDRKALRSTAQGVLQEASFTHMDCALGDLEMSALSAPRPLLYAYASTDESVERMAAFGSPTVERQIRAQYMALGRPGAFVVDKDSIWTSASHRRMRLWLDSAVSFSSRDVPAPVVAPKAPASERYQNAYMDSTALRRRQYIGLLGPCLPPPVEPVYESLDSYAASVEPLRRRIVRDLRIAPFNQTPVSQIIRTDTLVRGNRYTVEWVEIRSNRTPLPLVGLLATPRTLSDARLPAVISLDGNLDLRAPLGLAGRESVAYLNAYGDYLANNGHIVFVPFFPRDFPEIASTTLRARNPDGPTSWSFVLPHNFAAVDFVRSLSSVDTTRVGIWGISYEGVAALITAGLDTRITALVYSNPVTTAAVLFQDPDAAALAPWFRGVCSILDLTQQYLIAPRRFVRENGARDANGYERSPFESVNLIRDVYAKLGIASQFMFVRHSGGHETRPLAVFDH